VSRPDPLGGGSPLTSEQAAAAAAFGTWLDEPPSGRPFVLSGYAGTGKTFLSMHLLARAEAAGLCWTVVAPTHKAVDVQRRHLALAALSPTWYPSTLHRLLRLRLRRQGDVERCEETDQTAQSLEHLGLVLIDEASMVDGELLAITLRCAHAFGTRLVFVGDPAQLPPVGEETSPVFAMHRACRVALTRVVRHGGPVLRLAEGLRQGTLPCRPPPILPPWCREEGSVGLLERGAWLRQAQAALRSAAAEDDPDRARILCWTNRTLERLVPIARRALHGAMADQLPVLPGEVLITRAAVMAPACSAADAEAEEPDMVLGSNRELVVCDVTPERCSLAEWGGDDPLDPHPAMIETLTATVQAGEARYAIRLLPPIGSESRRRLEAALDRLRGQAREAGRDAGRRLWRRFFLLRDAFASVGPAAVLTVHRSQGSTFAEVFVEADVFRSPDERLRRQLVYVAVTRASRGVWLMAGGGAVAATREPWRRWMDGDENPQPASSPSMPCQPR
jgi:exodeoxyribonuclease-5